MTANCRLSLKHSSEVNDMANSLDKLLASENPERITGNQTKIADLLAMPKMADINLDIPRSREPARPADL